MSVLGWKPPEEIPELTVILGRGNRFRMLDIACAKDHRLAEVYRTTAGPVLYAKAYPVIPDAEAEQAGGMFVVPGARREALAMRLLPTCHDPIDAQCACGGAEIRRAWILDQLDGNVRRVVWHG